MPNSTQISKILYYKSLGKGFTDQGKPFFEEDPSIDGNIHIIPEQIWASADQIPDNSPFGTPDSTTMSTYDGSISGVVQYVHNLELEYKSTTGQDTYFSEDLKDSIPFNFGDGSYNYYITDQSGSKIAFGQGDWIVDNDQGKLTFYGSRPASVDGSNPPLISFYKYVGPKGLGNFDNLSVENLDVSTLKIDNLNGILEAVNGNVQVSSVQTLKSREMFIYGSGTDDSFTLSHGLNTLKHLVNIWDTSTNEKIQADVYQGTNNDTIEFNSNVPNGTNYRVVFMGF